MAFETPEQGETFFKLDLDEDRASLNTESEDLNSPQVEGNADNEISMCLGPRWPKPKVQILTIEWGEGGW